MTPAGIEPATFRFVAQHLNHCATAFPQDWGIRYADLLNESPYTLRSQVIKANLDL